MHLSIQLYTLRDVISADLEGTLSALAGMGLKFVEPAGLGNHSAEEWKGLLEKNGLEMSAQHIPWDRAVSDLDGLISQAKVIGYSTLVVGWVPPEQRGTSWKEFAATITPIAARVTDAGLEFAYHNHDFEFQLEDGEPGLDVLFENTPEFVKSQLDVAWVYQGGYDPIEYIRKYASRLACIHVKDTAERGKHVDVIHGTGAVDLVGCITAAREAGVPFAALEMDNPPSDPIEDVRKCVSYYHSVGLS